MSEKTCAEFMAAWKSEYENCHTCRYWDRDELTCINPEELARRKKVQEIADLEKMAKRNKPVAGPL